MSENKEKSKHISQNCDENKNLNQKAKSNRTFQSQPFQDVLDLYSEICLIPDSLPACKLTNKHCQTNIHHLSDLSHQQFLTPLATEELKTNLVRSSNSQIPVQILLPLEEQTLKFYQKREGKNTTVSDMTGNNTPQKYFKKSTTFASREELSAEKLESEKAWINDLASMAKSPYETSSSAELYPSEQIDSDKLMEIIQKELKILMNMSPSETSKVIELSDFIIHYKECSKCSKKFRKFLPLILNRIQKLVKCIGSKKSKNYVWSQNCSDLKICPKQPEICHIEKESQTPEEKSEILELAKLEKIDAFVLSDGRPGIQIQLLVKPEKATKRLFETVLKRKVKEDSGEKELFPVLHLNDHPYNSVVNILKPLPVPKTNTRVSGRSQRRESQMQKAKDLEIEMESLKDLISEILKNQTELSNVLLRKGIYCEPIIKLTDFNMLKEETKEINKATQSQMTRSSSAEAIQLRVHELKRKCNIKNQMIVTLLKGLHNNVSKKHWEELLIRIFNEANPIEEFDLERVNEVIGQTSLYLANREKACTTEYQVSAAPMEDSLKDGNNGSDQEMEFKKNIEHFEELIEIKRKELKKQTDRLTNRKLHKYTSSLVQDILHEDSQAGVYVFELVVAIKRAKDKLNIVTKVNNEIFNKMEDLNKEVEIIKFEYRELVENVNYFFDKMSDVTKSCMMKVNRMQTRGAEVSEKRIDRLKTLKEEQLKSECTSIENTSTNDENSKKNLELHKTQTRELFREKNKITEESKEKLNFSQDVVSYSQRQMNVKKKKLINGSKMPSNHGKLKIKALNMNPKDVVTALLVTSMGNNRCCSSKAISKKSIIGTKQGSTVEVFNLNEINIQMICDICEVMSLVIPEYYGRKENKIEDSLGFFLEEAHPKSFSEKENIIDCFQKSNMLLNCSSGKFVDEETKSSKHFLDFEKECSLKVPEDREDNASEGDSAFEEALNEPLSDDKTKSSFTCMVDLTKNDNKKSVSTLTTNNGIETSWIRKFKEDIKSKLRNLKPNFKERSAFVSDMEKPMKKFGGLEFTISASTPVGVFDVTVRQFKQCRRKAGESPDNTLINSNNISKTENEKSNSTKFNFMKETDCYWSDESLQNSDSDRLSQIESVSGEDEMEEFLEVYVQSKKSDEKDKQKYVSLEKGTMLKATIKQDRFPIFEIEKCHPKYFIQKILPKQATTEHENSTKVTDETLQASTPLINENSDDLVIYIQVEVDDEEEENEEKNSQKIYIECNSSSEKISVHPKKLSLNFDVISEAEVVQDSNSFEYIRIPKKQDINSLKKNDLKSCKSHSSSIEAKCKEYEMNKENIQIQKADKGTELNSEISINVQKQMELVFVKEPKKKFVQFEDECSNFQREIEILEILPEEEPSELIKVWEKSTALRFFFNEFKVEIYFFLNRLCHITWFDLRKEGDFTVERLIEKEAPELQTALNLIHEIENNVVGVKLSDAILILPNLESELRKHLQHKMKEMSEREPSVENSMDDFFSTADFWPEEEDNESEVFDGSEERLYHLFTLLSNLEDAVKMNETSTDKIELCDYGSSKIYKLLHELSKSIKDLDHGANMTNLTETLNIASQLDTAVREYDGIMRTQTENHAKPKTHMGTKDNSSRKSFLIKDQMMNLRKNVFQTVKKEAIKTEGRIERDFDRIDRLEKENEEAMKFVEALIEKMTRRTAELDLLKKEFRMLSLTLEEFYAQFYKQKKNAKNLQSLPKNGNPDSKREENLPKMEETVRNTVSGLLFALNNLKARAREKNETCKEILDNVFMDSSNKMKIHEKNVSRSSRSSFTAKTADDILCTIKDFKRIGENSLYMAWSKRESSMAEYLSGYEIVVNGKLNQKVRNPQRTQAVLYSIDLSKKVEIQLFGIMENGPKILLAAVTHYDT